MAHPGNIIAPGPAIKKIIDTAAPKIAANPDLIKMLMDNADHKHKFGFLNPDDPHQGIFYPYYLHRLAEAKAGNVGGGGGGAPNNNGGDGDDQPQPAGETAQGDNNENDDETAAPVAGADTSHAVKVDPHPNQFSIALEMGLESVPQLDLSVILEYVAKEIKYGTDFTSRFASSQLISQPLFEFLHPQSAKHALYRNVLAVYRRVQAAVAAPESIEGMIDELDLYTDANYVMGVCNESADASRAQQDVEAQRLAQSSASKFVDYDWQNFRTEGRGEGQKARASPIVKDDASSSSPEVSCCLGLGIISPTFIFSARRYSALHRHPSPPLLQL